MMPSLMQPARNVQAAEHETERLLPALSGRMPPADPAR